MPPRQPRLIDNGYLAYLRRQPCACGCGKGPPSDAAHIRIGSLAYDKPPTGMGEKPSDKWALPLNRSCHVRQHAFGSELEWWFEHGIDPFQLAIKTYRLFGGDGGKARPTRKIRPRKPIAQRQKIKSRGFR